MIRHSITVLPPREPNVKISNIFLNQQICSDFNISKKFIKIKKENNMFIKMQLFDIDNMRSVGIDYPNLFLNSYIYEEDTKDYTKMYLKFKKDGVIIKPGDKNIKLKINLIRQGEVIDYCLIDIV